jgi:hypothetical protein
MTPLQQHFVSASLTVTITPRTTECNLYETNKAWQAIPETATHQQYLAVGEAQQPAGADEPAVFKQKVRRAICQSDHNNSTFIVVDEFLKLLERFGDDTKSGAENNMTRILFEAFNHIGVHCRQGKRYAMIHGCAAAAVGKELGKHCRLRALRLSECYLAWTATQSLLVTRHAFNWWVLEDPSLHEAILSTKDAFTRAPTDDIVTFAP